MRNWFSAFKSKYFDPGLDLHVQSFNLLGLAGTAAGIIVAFLSGLSGAGAANTVFCLFASALGTVMLYVAEKKKCHRQCGWVVVIAVFMLAFPALFFTAGGYRSGMPCFFIFAFIFTAIMLEGHERTAALAVEFVLYIACCLIGYYRPETVTHYASESVYVFDVITGVAVSGLLLLSVVLLHLRMYHIRQTQINELNRELEARNETLTRFDKMKSDFLAAVAHEISAPLAVIAASSHDTLCLLKESPMNMTEIRDNHERIEKRVMLIDGIVTDLMDTVAIESGRLPLNRRLVNLSELLTDVCGAFFKQFDKNNNRIAFDLQPGLPQIWADPARIGQVMTNLLSNAVRHTKDGVITVKLSKTGKRHIISVSDDGEGMDAETAKVALKEYVSTRQAHWRHGIGLHVCRQIVLSHGGEIWIDSEKGHGTTVCFALAEESDGE